MTLAGTAIMGFGVSLAVIADMVMNSGEAFIKAVSDRTGHNFGNVKIAFDVGCVALAAGLSLLLFRGQIIGVREGTVISALLTGLVVEYFVRRLSHPLTAVLTAQENINKASGRAGGFVYILTFSFRLGQDHQLAVLLINGIVRLGRDAGVSCPAPQAVSSRQSPSSRQIPYFLMSPPPLSSDSVGFEGFYLLTAGCPSGRRTPGTW